MREETMNTTAIADAPENQGTLDLHISDPVSMLNEIARRYESTERILMEYVDNALDDAETLYRENNNRYPYRMKIEITIDFENKSVTIRDNCQGMSKETLERIIRNVGESQKRGLTWVNGRFGFGVQAFRAAAETIHFQTKNEDSPHLALELERNQHMGIQGAQVSTEAFPSNTGTGTQVIISAFEDEWFESVSAASIKREVESHFERLLARSKLEITVCEVGEEPLRCEPFRYQEVPGRVIHRTLKMKLNGDMYPVEVYLKIADFEVPGRTIRFFARGRRINHVAEIKSFIRKSVFRTSVWGHPHLLGYIEVGEIVRPVITRDDFVRNKGRKIFYDAILGLENEIKGALDRINEAQRDTTLNRLEDVLRQVLESIARQDRRQLRLYTAAQRKTKASKAGKNGSLESSETTLPPYETQSGANGHSLDGNGFQASSAKVFENSVEWQPGTGQNGSTGFPKHSNGGSGEHEQTPSGAPLLSPDDNVKFSYDVENPKPVRRRRNSFDIQFVDIPPDAHGQIKRSYMIDATIYINVAHSDFQDRMIHTRLGQPKVTDRLGAYIAATVSIHYKDQFYAQYGYAPERRELLFDEQVDFIFRLEAALREHLPALERELARQKKQEVELT